MAEYAIVPLSSLLVWLFFAALPSIAYHTDQPSDTPNRYPATFSTLLLGAALWTLSHMLRLPLYTFFAFISPNETAATLLSTAFHVVCRNFIRLAGLPLLLLRHAHPTWRDDAFGRVWCLALGCSFAEVVVACAQGFEQISLYRDVLVPYGRQGGEEDEGDMDLSASAKFQLRQQVERDVDHLLAFKAREEVEQIYGMPAIKIPVFVSCLQRIDAIILSLGLTLVISSAYLRSGISVFVTFPIAVALHLALSLLHTPMVLPRIGVHVAAYVGIIGGLGAFFAGLAMWGALS